nr:MAG TPA: hypothetical protein [Caudoviricetes sp.]
MGYFARIPLRISTIFSADSVLAVQRCCTVFNASVRSAILFSVFSMIFFHCDFSL